MQTFYKHKAIIFFGIIVILCATWISAANFSSDNKDKEYTYVVGPQKSDMQRMIEAYEKLSAQYLTLVQQHLQLMAAQDQQILTQLQTMEKKIDALTEQVNQLKESKEEKIQELKSSY
jgi:hypothetical protein